MIYLLDPLVSQKLFYLLDLIFYMFSSWAASVYSFWSFKAPSFPLYFFFFTLISFLFLICSSLSKQIKNKKEMENLELEILTSIELVKAHRFCPIFSKTDFQPKPFLSRTAHFIPRVNSVQIWWWKVAMVARYHGINSIRLSHF